MNVFVFVRSLATACTGLAAGVFLGHWRGVSLARPQLDPASFVQLQQVIHAHFVPMMPILLFGAAGASILWAVLLRSRAKERVFWLVAGAAVATTAVLGLTLAVNVPINNVLMTWSAEAPPPDLLAQWEPWEVSHSIRTVLALAAFAAQTIALSVPDGTRADRTPRMVA